MIETWTEVAATALTGTDQWHVDATELKVGDQPHRHELPVRPASSQADAEEL